MSTSTFAPDSRPMPVGHVVSPNGSAAPFISALPVFASTAVDWDRPALAGLDRDDVEVLAENELVARLAANPAAVVLVTARERVLMRSIAARAAGALIVALGIEDSFEEAVAAARAGASDYLPSSAGHDRMEGAIHHASTAIPEHFGREHARRVLSQEDGFENLVARSASVQNALATAASASRSSYPVLLRGERGTGRETVARAMHKRSGAQGPFVRVEGGALSMESWSAAMAAAQGGVLYVQEVGALTPTLQAALLDLFAEGRGNVRVIAATEIDLQSAAANGSFRHDLYYRLAAVQIQLPPLRDRLDDLQDLTRAFFEEARAREGKIDLQWESSLDAGLRRYSWPGNLDELQSVVEGLVAVAAGPPLNAADLPQTLRLERSVFDELRLELPESGVNLEAVEKELLYLALERSHWNQTRAARFLGLTRKTLIYRMEKYDLRKREAHAANA